MPGWRHPVDPGPPDNGWIHPAAAPPSDPGHAAAPAGDEPPALLTPASGAVAARIAHLTRVDPACARRPREAQLEQLQQMVDLAVDAHIAGIPTYNVLVGIAAQAILAATGSED
jgi:hypothetical protein